MEKESLRSYSYLGKGEKARLMAQGFMTQGVEGTASSGLGKLPFCLDRRGPVVHGDAASWWRLAALCRGVVVRRASVEGCRVFWQGMSGMVGSFIAQCVKLELS